MLLPLFAVAGCGDGHGRHSALLVTLDTTRADALSCYGQRTGTTPELDALARESVLYERAFTAMPGTLPAHASLLTGLYPLRHGLRDNGLARLDAAALTVAEAARAAGAETAAFVGAVVLDRAFGLDQGFDVYDGPPPRRSNEGHPLERPAREVIDAALAWLERRPREGARPFFLWVHLYDPHHPYEPPHEPDGPGKRSGSELERYLAEVSAMDAELGRLFAFLRASALFDETLVCVVADHGEAFGEHQELTHGPFCWDTTLRVPLLVRHPDSARAGERSRELASVVDVAPTLAQALGAELGPDVDGRSLLAPVPDERGLYFESYAGYLAFGWSPLAGWLDGRGKYVHGARPEFFDLERDPREEHDLAPELDAARLERYRAAIGALAARAALSGSPDASGAIDAELRQGIQDLGYAGASLGGAELEFPHPLAPGDGPSPHDMAAAWRESMGAQEKLNQGRFAEAAAIYRRVLDVDPGNRFVRGQLATCLMRLKEHGEAAEVLLPLLDGPLVAPHVFYKLGLCELKLGRRDEALAHLERAVELAPSELRYREKLEAARRGEAGETGEEDG